jgi:hypothetical protein
MGPGPIDWVIEKPGPLPESGICEAPVEDPARGAQARIAGVRVHRLCRGLELIMENWSTGVLEKTALENIQSEIINKRYLNHVLSIGKKFVCWLLFHHSITPK